MVWMEVENETCSGPCAVVAGLLLLAVLPAVWWVAGWEYALAVWLGMLIVAGTMDWFALAWRIPSEAKAASRLALAEFKRLHPADEVKGVAVRSVEPERFVFSVRYETSNIVSFPTARR